MKNEENVNFYSIKRLKTFVFLDNFFKFGIFFENYY